MHPFALPKPSFHSIYSSTISCPHTYTQTHIQTHTHTYIHTYTYIYIHTHIKSHSVELRRLQVQFGEYLRGAARKLESNAITTRMMNLQSASHRSLYCGRQGKGREGRREGERERERDRCEEGSGARQGEREG